MGCRPTWDHATGRVTGIEVLPAATIGRPRVDVTWRISGLFRDLFPAQIALLDAAVRTVAAREEPDDGESAGGGAARIGATARRARAHLRHRAGRLRRRHRGHARARDATATRIGAAYLAAASHAYGGADGDGTPAPGGFAAARRQRRPAGASGR